MSTFEFYSRFFSRNTFLSPSTSGVYSESEYLKSLGFSADLDLTDKTVLELGAGAGRITSALQKLEVIKSAAKYIVVEPSSGIERLRERLPFENVSFVNAGLRDLGQHVPLGSIDYFIASGVIPHVNYRSLDEIIAAIVPYLSENGRLHINSSFYGYDKRGHFLFRDLCRRMPSLTSVAAAAVASLQLILCGIGSEVARSFYIRNFLFSFQRGFVQKYRFMLEVLSVNPYAIYWGYHAHLSALAKNGLRARKIFPHSIALMAERTSGEEDEILLPPSGSVAVFGGDWSGRWFTKKLGREVSFVDNVDAATKYDTVILAYDYSQNAPYYAVATLLMERGYVLGKSLYFFQMLIDEAEQMPAEALEMNG
jgi:SAM-dependent methyltransferase